MGQAEHICTLGTIVSVGTCHLEGTLDADSVGNYHKNYIMGDREQSRLTNGSNVIIPQVAAFLWDVDVD